MLHNIYFTNLKWKLKYNKNLWVLHEITAKGSNPIELQCFWEEGEEEEKNTQRNKRKQKQYRYPILVSGAKIA